MFKFLLGRGKTKVVQETQRQTFERALGELNEILAGMEEKPVLRLDLTKGQMEADLPEQMPDEALALPAPKTPEEPEASDVEEKKAA